MNKQFYFLSPVDVMKVTSHNLEEVAEWCGGSVQETESRRVAGRMDKYVLVPTPKNDKNISWAFPGMFVTKRLVVTVKDELRATYAVFRRDYFEKNYFETPKLAADATWEREAVEKSRPAPVKVVNNVGEALLKEQAKQAMAKMVGPTYKVTAGEDGTLVATPITELPEDSEIIPVEVPEGVTVKIDEATDEIPVEDLRGLTEADVERAFAEPEVDA